MEPITFIALGALGLTGGWAVSRIRERARTRAWLAAARRLELGAISAQPRQSVIGPRLTATAGALNVQLDPFMVDKWESGTRIWIDGLGHGTEPLTLKYQGPKQPAGREIEIGDPAFDDEVWIQGPAPLALALLDAPTRERLLPLLRGEVKAPPERLPLGAVLDAGGLLVLIRHSAFKDPAEPVYQALRLALAAAPSLAAPADLPARLIANLCREPLAGVRRNIVAALAQEYPDHPEARRALLAALQDRHGGVRLRAATALGEDGHETLLALASFPDDAHASQAIAALGPKLPLDRVKALLARALKERRPQTAAACVHSLAQHGGPEAEALLLAAFAGDDPAVQVAAVRALGRIGTASAVPALKAEASSLLPNPLSRAARQAIAEIQARLTGAAPGQLSLAVSQAGDLSLAGGENGELSLAGSPWEAGAPPGVS